MKGKSIMVNIRVEKLCKKDHKKEDSWILSHVKFCREGDIVRINGKKDKFFQSVSDPIWSTAHKDYDMKFTM